MDVKASYTMKLFTQWMLWRMSRGINLLKQISEFLLGAFLRDFPLDRKTMQRGKTIEILELAEYTGTFRGKPNKFEMIRERDIPRSLGI